jgi:hypothetical protein
MRGSRRCSALRTLVFFHPQVLDLPAFPVLGYFHAFFPASIESFVPLLSSCRATAESLVELVRDFLDMLLVVELCDFNVGWRIDRLQSVCRNVVLVAREESERKGRAQGGGSREEKARVLDMSVATQD